MNKGRIMAIRSFLGMEQISKEDVIDILMTFISKEHLNSLSNLISSGYSLEEIKDIEVYKNE
tara:strand:- start:52 stop:237 length:186 start_codon:yes stop_codon:yes gene_type:complete